MATNKHAIIRYQALDKCFRNIENDISWMINQKTKNWQLIEADNDVSQNENWIEGEVINQDESKGYAFLSPSNGSRNQYIPADSVSSFSLTNGCKVKGEIEEYTNKKGESKTRIKNIEII